MHFYHVSLGSSIASKTIVSNSILLVFLFLAFSLCRAHKALKLAQQFGSADKISFSTLVHAYAKKQDFPNMEAALWEMQNAGYGSSLEAYNSILDAYGKAGQMEKVSDVLARMENSGMRMDLASYNILINTYGKNYMIAEMETLFRTMQVSSCIFNPALNVKFCTTGEFDHDKYLAM